MPKHFNSSNSKMDKLRKKHKLKKPIACFGIPAIKTCPQAGDCKKAFKTEGEKKYSCFATQGPYAWPAVEAAYERRFKHTKSKSFVPDMVDSLNRGTTHVRLHDSGDFYSDAYLWKWIKVMQWHPDIKFWCYTKSVSMFKQFEDKGLMPDNFHYVFSEGGREDHLIDPSKDRYSKCVAPDRVEVFKHNGFKDLTEDELQILDKNHRLFFTVAH